MRTKTKPPLVKFEIHQGKLYYYKITTKRVYLKNFDISNNTKELLKRVKSLQ